MCLSRTFSKGKIERIIKRLPEEITVYKVVKLNDSEQEYTGVYWDHFSYKEGENTAEIREHDQDAGFYSFKIKLAAFFYKIALIGGGIRSGVKIKIIKCKLYKKDILLIGRQEGKFSFVSSKLTVPKYEGK